MISLRLSPHPLTSSHFVVFPAIIIATHSLLSQWNFPKLCTSSSRLAFQGNPTEAQARELNEELKNKHHLKSVIVDAKAGDDFGDMTMHCLQKMEAMVVFGSEEYGALTDNPFSSYHELKNANTNNIHMIVIQLCTEWPPKPTRGDKDGRGAQQNSFILGNKGLSKLRWHRKKWDAAQCAEEVALAFHARHSSRSSQVVPVNTAPLSALERQQMNDRALSRVAVNQIDVCIILLHSPSMLHRLSNTSKTIYEMERKLYPLSIDYKISILLVDGNDPVMMNKLMENLKKIKSLIFIGEGLSYEESVQATGIFKVLKKLYDEHECRPKVSIAFRYGAKSFKNDLENQGYKDVNVWERDNLYGRLGMLEQHFSSLDKKEGGGSGSVEVLAWTLPTEEWRRDFRGKLKLKVGDAQTIEEIKDAVIQAVKSREAKCIHIRPSSSCKNGDEADRCVRSNTFFGCQEASKTVIETLDRHSVGWKYASNNEHLMQIAKEIEGKDRSGHSVIWIDFRHASALNLNDFMKKRFNGEIMIYIVTNDTKTQEEDIVGLIEEEYDLNDGDGDIKHIDIHTPKTDIELSEHEVGVDVRLLKMPKKYDTKVEEIMLEELYDTSSDNIEKHEASFYNGDDDSLHVHLGVRHIQQLKRIFNLTYLPDSRKTLENKLKGIGSKIELQFEMKNSLQIFKDCVLKLNTLTHPQKKALRRILDLQFVVIDGPAGCGRTYLALHCMLDLLENDIAGIKYMLIVLDVKPLGNEIAKWICIRLGGSKNTMKKKFKRGAMNEKLKRIHFLYRSDGNANLYQAKIDDKGEELLQDAINFEGNYGLIVLEEGHQVFTKGNCE